MRNSGPNAQRLLRPNDQGGAGRWSIPDDEQWIDPVPALTTAEQAAYRAQREADKRATDNGDPLDQGAAAVAIRARVKAHSDYENFLTFAEGFSRVAVEIVAPVAPSAPSAVKREAAARVEGWLRDTSPSRAATQAAMNGEGFHHGGITLGSEQAQYRPAVQGALRGSGALALLAPWIERRAV